MTEPQFLSMNNITIWIQSISLSSNISSTLCAQDLKECKQSMEQMAKRGRKDGEETKESDYLPLTPDSHLLLGKAA